MNITDSIKSPNWISFGKKLQDVSIYFDKNQEIGNWEIWGSRKQERML
jgi:hypothetical protein